MQSRLNTRPLLRCPAEGKLWRICGVARCRGTNADAHAASVTHECSGETYRGLQNQPNEAKFER